MPANHYVAGQWNVICDSCGFKKKSGQVRKRWDGLIVCADTCYEVDHPQKYLRVRETGVAVPFIREDTNVFGHVCWIYEISAYADLASADCAKADNTNFTYVFLLGLKLSGFPPAVGAIPVPPIPPSGPSGLKFNSATNSGYLALISVGGM